MWEGYYNNLELILTASRKYTKIGRGENSGEKTQPCFNRVVSSQQNYATYLAWRESEHLLDLTIGGSIIYKIYADDTEKKI